MRVLLTSMNGWTLTRVKSMLLSIHARLLNWLSDMARRLFRGFADFEYRQTVARFMLALRKRFEILLDRFPARRRLQELERDFWHLHEEWERIDREYRLLYAKHMELNEEVRYWETRHAKVLNYIEKQMEMSEGDITK